MSFSSCPLSFKPQTGPCDDACRDPVSETETLTSSGQPRLEPGIRHPRMSNSYTSGFLEKITQPQIRQRSLGENEFVIPGESPLVDGQAEPPIEREAVQSRNP